MPDTEIK